MVKPLSYIFSFFTALILLLSPSISAQSRSNIPVGNSLSAIINGSSWLSPSGDFAFGFHQYLNHTNLFLLAIWYAKIPDTIVWFANEGNPVPQGSSVTITTDEGLILSNPQGSNLWNTSSDLNGNVVSYGFMSDTGNMILTSSSDSNPVWQSFEHPTDTLLPTQVMNIEGAVDSRLSETNFTKGRYQLRLQTDGNAVLHVMDQTIYWADTRPYFASNTWNPPNQGKQVIYNVSGQMYVAAENGTAVYNFIPEDTVIVSSRDYYQRVTLSFYGLLTWYYHPRNFTNNEVGWSKMYSIIVNICNVGCGFNSICSYDDVAHSISCDCPSHYSLVDPTDKYGSCKPDFQLSEDDGKDGVFVEYNLVRLQNTKFDSDKCDKRFEGITEEQCKSSCLGDRFCAVATWVGDKDTCCKYKPLFSGGNHDRKVSETAWLKVGNGTYSTAPLITKEKTKLNTVVSVLLGGSVFVNLGLLMVGFFFIYRKKQLRSVKQPRKEYDNVHCFSYKVLEEATDGFKEELGRGAFGAVYKGVIGAGNYLTFVAVKKLDRISNNADKEFETEVNTIGKTHHKNLVRLVGFCKEGDQRLLVYEFMRNGSLADFLFGDHRPSWEARIKTSEGIARGLLYLHEECSTQIIHCDIKPQNILLDDHQNALIADFGIAKLMAQNQTHTTTAIRGTKGYVAPEWFKNKPVTLKVDVYSFGVILLEIICCRRSVCMDRIEEEEAILTDWAFDCYFSNRLDQLVNDDIEAISDIIRLKRFVKISLWCIQEDPSLRPSMRAVTQMLEGLVEVPAPPCPTSIASGTR
ncbi:hypothetical protein SOVF_008980 [Spinacia oleracea]|nr:hypothetical protein SOVF_008980 [Spinacia oleracea]